MSNAALLGAIRAHGAMAAEQTAVTKNGEVTAYNPAAFTIKVTFPPDETETGWIPLGSPWVGNGWGMFCAPSLGDQVEIDFQDGSQNAPKTGMRFFDAQNAPLNVPSGEFWLIHKSGAYFKLTNDGKLTIIDGHGAQIQLDGAGNISSQGNWTHNGNLTVQNGTTAVAGITSNGHDVGSTHKHLNSGGSGLGGVPQ